MWFDVNDENSKNDFFANVKKRQKEHKLLSIR